MREGEKGRMENVRIGECENETMRKWEIGRMEEYENKTMRECENVKIGE